MEGVLNERTRTVHKKGVENPHSRSKCGATKGVSHDQIRAVRVERAVEDFDAHRCGRCFSDAGGY
ncbi:hypothetical protein [Halobacterium yunchengense]|uniref:hypothetical protein n=1 Tax=Halobacterium yunchengense TaxID=3108497 RepID=UPI00300900CC